MLRLFTLTTFALSPASYYALKAAAISRHLLWQELVEHDDRRTLRDTWHADAIAWVYPL